jgi:hypothetical protein
LDLFREHSNAIRYYWLAILGGAIIALTGFAMSMNTSCFGISPNSLYSLCEDFTALVVTIAGGLIMLVGAILLSGILLKSRRNLVARSEGDAVTHVADIQLSGKEKATKRTWTLVIIAIAIGGIMLTSSATRAVAWRIYITKIPLHVGIDGLNNTYQVGEKIDFYVTLEGYGHDCGFPDISVWSADRTQYTPIWQLDSGDGNTVCSVFPVDVPKRVLHVGTSETKPLIVNGTGFYLAYIEGSIGQEFEVVNKP